MSLVLRKEKNMDNTIPKQARRLILDELTMLGSVSGHLELPEFLKRIFPKFSEMGSTDYRYTTAEADVRQHMELCNDWSFDYLWYTYLDIENIPDDEFLYLLEQYVHPIIRRSRITEDLEREYFENSDCAEIINKHLISCGFKLTPCETLGDKQIYKAVPVKSGVKGQVKNIIFAATYKPEISFIDALNNDIKITANEDKCLVYDRDIPSDGLYWSTLVKWYAEKYGITEAQEKEYIKRLADSLDSAPEKMLLQAYCTLRHEKNIDLPALIPQVYLYYDPQTIKQRGWKLFEHQKMDFLMIFSMSNRIVIEIDGKQHYAIGDRACPELYANMVAAQREMTLCGYDVYRFGGHEFQGDKEEVIKKLQNFFVNLMKKHNVITNGNEKN